MALNVSPCWTLILGACMALTVSADCEKDCELCLLHLKGRQADLSLVTCLQECEGIVTMTTSLDLCKDILEGNLADVLMVEDPGQGLDEQLAERYGGFMRRYGGFMKKTAEVAAETAEGTGKRYGGFMKRDDESRRDALKELLAAVGGEAGDGEAAKRYGGFMRAVTGSAELGEDVKVLQKRYGGFMRRVGSPTWEDNKKTYEGFRKRSWGSDAEPGSPLQERRYGGFMD